MGNIVTANVGASVGGAVLAEPVSASYATWPSMLTKTINDIQTIMLAKLTSESRGETNLQPGPGPTPGATATGSLETYSAVFSRETFMLIGLIIALIVGLRFLR